VLKKITTTALKTRGWLRSRIIDEMTNQEFPTKSNGRKAGGVKGRYRTLVDFLTLQRPFILSFKEKLVIYGNVARTPARPNFGSIKQTPVLQLLSKCTSKKEKHPQKLAGTKDRSRKVPQTDLKTKTSYDPRT